MIILFTYFIILLIIARITSRNSSAATFFNGDKSSPWYLVAFGTIGASISGVTFVSVPGEVSVKSWHYLQFVAGNFIGYWIIALILIPLYYKLQTISIYEYLRQRLGDKSHKTGSVFFLISQFIGASFRLFLVVSVLQILIFDELNVPFAATAALSLIMIWLYIRQSGIKTIVWTDTLQTISIIVAVVMTVVAICNSLDINAKEMLSTLASHPTTDLIDTDFTSPTHFLKQLISGIAIVIVMNGLDQNIMQKSLTCRTMGEAKKNMFTFSFAFLLTNILFVALGSLLCIYAEQKGIALPHSTDDIFPFIVHQHLPHAVGIAFLIGIIAAAYSSADSSLTALTTVTCLDIMHLDPNAETTTRKRKIITIAFALLMFAAVTIFRAINNQSVVSAIFTIAGYTYGPLLGLFAFGIATQRKTRERFVPYICIASPILSYAISLFCATYLNYNMGFELIVINGTLVFTLLMITSRKGQKL